MYMYDKINVLYETGLKASEKSKYDGHSEDLKFGNNSEESEPDGYTLLYDRTSVRENKCVVR